MIRFAFSFILVIILATMNAAYAKNCKKGKPCGNTCIAWNKKCHVGSGDYSSPSRSSSKEKTRKRSSNSSSSANSSYLSYPSRHKNTSSDADTSALKKYYEIVVDKTPVLSCPKRECDVLRKLAIHSIVQAYAIQNNFLLISDSPEKQEWVSKSRVQ